MSLLHIGNNLDKKTSQNLTDSIVKILRTGKECHTDREVMLKALDVITEANAVSDVSVTNSAFNGPT